jgi:pSer/pThr/pTyr-binding forkhead associated (FHA) protein
MIKFSADLAAGTMVTRVSELVISIGRGCDNIVVLDDPTVSTTHARLSWTGSAYRIEDMGSTNGILVEGVAISEGWISSSLTCFIGAVRCVLEVCDPCFVCSDESQFLIASSIVTVGRAVENNWVLPYPSVSSHHLNLIQEGEQMFVHNFSAQGTRVSGLMINEAPLAPGDEIQLGEISILYATPPLLNDGFRFEPNQIGGERMAGQFCVVGSLDRDQAEAFEGRLRVASMDSGNTLDIDMSACNKLHPMCLDVLLNVTREFTASNKRLRLIAPSQAVTRAVALANARQQLIIVG